MIKILPSLASADQMHLANEIQKVKFLGYMHFDIEDGNFVPNITFGLKTIKGASIFLSDVLCDAHLMVTNPSDYIEDLAMTGFKAVAIHWENAPYPRRLICEIRKLGMKAGLALNLRTQPWEIEKYLEEIDYVLLMSSEPDNAGDLFQESVLEKIHYLRRISKKIEIIVDGGVNEDNYQNVISAGANGVVLGRAIFQTRDVGKLLTKLRMKEREK